MTDADVTRSARRKRRQESDEEQDEGSDDTYGAQNGADAPPPAAPEGETGATVHHEQVASPHPLTSRVKFRLSNRDFRARAHSNPLNDGNFDVPRSPASVDWSEAYPPPPGGGVADTRRAPEWVDIGCGYGGLLAQLSTAFPDTFMLGLEIRDRVLDFCVQRLLQLREDHAGAYGNIWYIRTNAMKYLVHFFERSSVHKLFFCYPDPHFKRKKHRQRIISPQLLAEYAYVLAPGGRAYVVTDVAELFHWMQLRFAAHPLFTALSQEKMDADDVLVYVRDRTDEATRVQKHNIAKHCAVFERLPDPT